MAGICQEPEMLYWIISICRWTTQKSIIPRCGIASPIVWWEGQWLNPVINLSFQCLDTEETALQIFRISPWEPVSGSISPILTIADAKSNMKASELLLYSATISSVDPPLNRTWSVSRRPFFSTRFL